MIHARRDYDRIQDPTGKIPLDEPVFLIRGQDPIGWLTVMSWLSHHLGVSFETVMSSRNGGYVGTSELERAIHLHADKMRMWAHHRNHGPATVSDDQLRLW